MKMDCSPETGVVHRQGYLVKKGHVRHSWRTRWFVLKKNSLEYFKTRQDVKPKGRIQLLGASLNCPVYDSSVVRQWMLVITTVEGKEYSLQAPDEVTRNEWRTALEENIRRLDPSKRGLCKRGVTLSRSLLPEAVAEPNKDELSKQREIIEAMQDSSAGLMLKELRRGRLGRHVDKYFTGVEAVDWLIAWFFVSTRSEAVALCNCMLRNGLFLAITEEDSGKNGLTKSTIAADKHACNVFQDSDTARYIFVSFASSRSVEKLVFNDAYSEVDENNVSLSSSPDDSPEVSAHKTSHHSSENNGFKKNSFQDKTIKQGFLLKQGHLRKNWKIRRFVLQDTHLYYYRIEKIKTKPQGMIPLTDSTLSIVEQDRGSVESPRSPKRHSLPARSVSQINSPSQPHMFCIETHDHVKYIIQADSDEERLEWMMDISKQITKLKTDSSTN